ncbi:hypothetical protein G7Y89_g2097 [Cudoniella acicularis]|uniref:Uncharacterized protein n=1 Tax=Cudoniella acicularis TaxID=354080 RepID=A0A8H4W8Y3_9HELO|nr:hypothetical protein G7Y89_g2097 [Cudoniella acicularis]
MTNFCLARRGSSVLSWLDNLPTPNIITPPCSPPKAEPKPVAAMDSDDPWNWSIDRVVQELCTENRSWQPRSSATLKPDPAKLEKTLRDQEVTGEVLLQYVDDEFLKTDLEIKVLGRRAFIHGAIAELKLMSPKYQLYRERDHPLSGASSYVPQSINDSGRLAGFAFEQARSATLSRDNGQQTSFVVSDESGNKRRKVDAEDLSGYLEIEYDTGADNPGTPDRALESGILTPAPEPNVVQINGKKRKRIAPTLISTTIDPNRDREIPTDADNVIQNDPQNVEPGVVYIGDDGKKRLMPICQTDPAEVLPLISDGASSAVRKRVSSTAKTSNTRKSKGWKKMSVDDIFYPSVKIGEELQALDEEREFLQSSQDIPTGQRLYVHSVMKSFLRNQPIAFNRGEEDFSAVIPYASKFAPKFLKPSFTLFHQDPEGQIHAKREELSSWPEVDPEASVQLPSAGILDDTYVKFKLPGQEIQNGLDFPDNYDYLEKYIYVEGGDEVLPVYGDSDSENDYDEAMWREIEAERGHELKQIEKETKKLPLSDDEVNTIIDEGIIQLSAKWKLKKLPRLLPKARRIWQKSRKHRSQIRDIQELQKTKTHAEEQLAKTRKDGFLDDVWYSKSQVLKMLPILEQIVFNYESARWKISVLEKSKCPEKLPADVLAKKSSIPENSKDNEGEGESLDTDAALSSSEDGLDEFIVDDVLSEHELNLADGEGSEEDATMSDASIPKASPKRSFTPIKAVEFVRRGLQPSSPSPSPSALQNRSPARFVKDEPTLSQHPAAGPSSSPPNVIDLTMLSSDSGPEVWDLTTPRKRKHTRPLVRLINRNSPFSSPIRISDDDDLELPGSGNIPSFYDIAAIGQFPLRFWNGTQDRTRLLIAILFNMDEFSRGRIFNLINDVTENDLWVHMSEVMGANNVSEENIKGMDQSLFETLTIFLRLFEIFIDCKSHPYREKLKKNTIEKLKNGQAQWYPDFYTLCRQLPGYFNAQPELKGKEKGKGKKKVQDEDEDEDEDEDDEVFVDAVEGKLRDSENDEDDEDGEPVSAVRRRRSGAISTEEDPEVEDTPKKLRKKRKIHEDEAARNLREQDRLRIAEQEERRMKLRAALAKSGHDMDGVKGQIIINDAKSDDQGYVLVHPDTAARIKKHQIEGIRFMWNQIVADENTQQGCLLAHTMGLGKTMQVITLLVAIAQAANSEDPTVVSQIPKSLRESRTLVLCPPTLVDNWMDELLTWAPKDLLGYLRKLDAASKPEERLLGISRWFGDGGVLIMGYEMFRNLVHNKKTKVREPPLSTEQHERVLKELLEGPNIIVADEAHKLKNSKASITTAAAQFKSKSRIALTGSPLANNVEEYHSMIDWVAPNYLGAIKEFRWKYVEPIQTGLWQDSSSAERRKCLKMLGVLKQDIAPKVHRADMAVLRNDLPPKKEFVITVPLTELQRKAYSLYVKSMTSGQDHALTKNGEVTQATLWHWLGVLSLLCNHPGCFNKKLSERKEEAKRDVAATNRGISDVEAAIEDDYNQPIWKVGVSQDLIREETSLFREEGVDMESIELSNKIKILCQILDASKAVGDKVLVFSQSIPTLDFLEALCVRQGRKIARLDGKTLMRKRQALTKDFNGGNKELYLISTSAGGLGLNLPGANRVVIFDFKFNPIMEEQAVGRAYRIGQKKETFVYRFVAGGTFEGTVLNKTIFKTQLASRVVDKKNPIAYATRKISDFLFEPREVEQKDLSEFKGMDPKVLDVILASQGEAGTIRAIVQTDTFERDDNNEKLTADEEKEVQILLKEEQLKRSNPQAFADRQQYQPLLGIPPQIPVNSVLPHNRAVYSVPQSHFAAQSSRMSSPYHASLPAAQQYAPSTGRIAPPAQVGGPTPAPPLPAAQPSVPQIPPPPRPAAATSASSVQSSVGVSGKSGNPNPDSTPHDSALANSDKNQPESSRSDAAAVLTPDAKRTGSELSRGRSPIRSSNTKVRSVTPEHPLSPSPASINQNRGHSLTRNNESPQKHRKFLRYIEDVLAGTLTKGLPLDQLKENARKLTKAFKKLTKHQVAKDQILQDIHSALQTDRAKRQALLSSELTPEALIHELENSRRSPSRSIENDITKVRFSTNPSQYVVPPVPKFKGARKSVQETASRFKESQTFSQEEDPFRSRQSSSDQRPKPYIFRHLLCSQLQEYLRRHGVSDVGNRLALIQRCEKTQNNLLARNKVQPVHAIQSLLLDEENENSPSSASNARPTKEALAERFSKSISRQPQT